MSTQAIAGLHIAENALPARLQKPWRWRDVWNLRRSWFLRRMRRFWKWVSDTGRVLWPCRVGAGVLIAASYLAGLTDQGRELTLGLAHASGWAMILFLVMQGWWIFLSGLWARIVVNAAFSLDRKHDRNGTRRLSRRMRWLVKRAPGVIGALAGVFGAVPFFIFWIMSNDRDYALAAAASFAMAFLAWWCSFICGRACNRERGGLWLTRLIRKQCDNQLFKPPPHVSKTRSYTSLKDLPPAERIFAYASVAVSLFLAATFVTPWAMPIAMKVGTLAVAFSAFASLVAIGSLLIFRSYSWRFPVDIMIMILALLLSYWPWTDNHGVRVRRGQTGTTVGTPARVVSAEPVMKLPSERWTLEDAFERWKVARQKRQDSRKAQEHLTGGTQGQPQPLVIVATAGGGLRAAYWTAVVLGAIEERLPGFHEHVFAISGVSGGSFGAALFDALLMPELSDAWQRSDCKDKTKFPGRARCILEQDYLAAAVAGALYPDLLQRFIPVPFLPDRAMAAEQGWEEGWRKKNILLASGESPFAQPFLRLWDDCDPKAGCWRPALLLNGTHVETGKRIITSNLKINKEIDKETEKETFNEIFTDAADVYDLIGDKEDFRVSTAVNNSARFPYVAPAGTLRQNGDVTAHIVDGGYFENFGAITAGELLRSAVDHFGDTIRPIIIQISSDPDLTDKQLPVCEGGHEGDTSAPDAKPRTELRDAKSITEYWAPLDAFFATREARGILAAKELCRLASGPGALPVKGEQNATATNGGKNARLGANFFHFRMCTSTDGLCPGLGWSMSKGSFNSIEQFIEKCGKDNDRNIRERNISELIALFGEREDLPAQQMSLQDAPL